MSVSKRAYWKGRLQELAGELRQLKVAQGVLADWPEPGKSNLSSLGRALNEVIDKAAKKCEELAVDPMDRYVENAVRVLYDFALFLRIHREALFPSFTRELHLLFNFMEDLACTFPRGASTLSPGEAFVLVPTGMFSMTSFRDLLELRARLVGVSSPGTTGPSIFCLECASNVRLDKAVVLAHEVMHVTVFKNRNLLDASFQKLLLESAVSDLLKCLSRIEPGIDAVGYLEELFCDFASAWHVGPVYATAFVAEIEHYARGVTPSHPPVALRMGLIAAALGETCPSDARTSYSMEKKSLCGRLGVNRQVVEAALRAIRRDFSALLPSQLSLSRLRRSAWCDHETMLRYIIHNLPYIYCDIRRFLNGIPAWVKIDRALASRNIDEHDRPIFFQEFLEESVLRSKAFDLFKKAAARLQPGSSLPVPNAFRDEGGGNLP